MKEAMNRRKAVGEQYRTADNLSARISIHNKYSTNKLGFGNWIASHYAFSPDTEVLELGCGTGEMWREHLYLLDKNVRLLLTDISEGMVSSAKNTLGVPPNISYGVVDMEDIPYETGRFGGVIANMVLHHVPDIGKALSEVRRVLSDEGRFYCATHGEDGIVPFLARSLQEYGATDTANKNFTLQNGEGILKNYFSEVQRFDYEDALAVTNLEDMLDYIDSLTGMSAVAGIGRETVKAALEKKMAGGVLRVPKEYGMFICRK